MGNVTVVMGDSGSGKDTLAGLLMADANTRNIKFTEAIKENFENLYQLEPGSLNNKEFRKRMMPTQNKTWNQFLVDSFFHLRALDPQIAIYSTIIKLDKIKTGWTNFVFTDVRVVEEVQVVLQMMEEGYSFNLVWLTSNRAVPQPSDINQRQIFNLVVPVANAVLYFDNSGTIQELRKFAERIPR